MARYPRVPIEPGEVFAELTVMEEIEPGPPSNRRVRCRCSCGNEKIAFVSNLRLGRTRSCGCTYVFGAASRAAIVERRRALSLESELGRVCHTCGTWKVWELFINDPRRRNGKSSNCRECARWRGMRQRYGIGREEWTRMQSDQGGCALCGETEQLAVDHDHSCCGQVHGCRRCIRGLLCDFCNRVLGRIEQKPELATRFADYLGRRPLLV